MNLSTKVTHEIQALEEALWKTETRYDLAFQEQVFAPDFFEFGRSGRIYSRAEAVRTEAQPIRAKLPLPDFTIHIINSETLLVTYISEVQYEKLERANRSSLWSKTPQGWKLRFHQGTPIA